METKNKEGSKVEKLEARRSTGVHHEREVEEEEKEEGTRCLSVLRDLEKPERAARRGGLTTFTQPATRPPSHPVNHPTTPPSHPSPTQPILPYRPLTHHPTPSSTQPPCQIALPASQRFTARLFLHHSVSLNEGLLVQTVILCARQLVTGM